MTTLKSLMGRRAKETAANTNPINTSNQPTANTIDLQTGFMSYHRKFELVSEFVTSINDVLAISDRYYYGAHYVWYHTTKHILKNAFNEYPKPGINYKKVMVSRGLLWNTQRATAKANSTDIVFSWVNDSGIGGANANDQCVLVAYCPALNKCIFTKTGGERKTGKAELDVSEFKLQTVHTWLGFTSADGSLIANSIYTGELIVTQ